MTPIRSWLSDQTWMVLALLLLTGTLLWLVGTWLWRAHREPTARNGWRNR